MAGINPNIRQVTIASAAVKEYADGSGDIQSLQTAIGVEDPQVVTLQWTTDEAGAAGGTWTVTTGSGANLKTVATGDAGTAPAVGHFARFTIPTNGQANGPGGFLQKQPIPAQVVYSITVQPYGKQHNALGAASPSVTVTQAPKAPHSWAHHPKRHTDRVRCRHWKTDIGNADIECGDLTG